MRCRSKRISLRWRDIFIPMALDLNKEVLTDAELKSRLENGLIELPPLLSHQTISVGATQFKRILLHLEVSKLIEQCYKDDEWRNPCPAWSLTQKGKKALYESVERKPKSGTIAAEKPSG